MASNVVVMHNNRRYVVKTTPSMLCREVLNQACEKIGFKEPELYGLKYDALLVAINFKEREEYSRSITTVAFI